MQRLRKFGYDFKGICNLASVVNLMTPDQVTAMDKLLAPGQSADFYEGVILGLMTSQGFYMNLGINLQQAIAPASIVCGVAAHRLLKALGFTDKDIRAGCEDLSEADELIAGVTAWFETGLDKLAGKLKI
jgi:hypothetical protein